MPDGSRTEHEQPETFPHKPGCPTLDRVRVGTAAMGEGI